MGLLKGGTEYEPFDRAIAQDDQYVIRVNKNRMNVEYETVFLNNVWRRGFQLFSIFEQNGNTVMVFEKMGYQ